MTPREFPGNRKAGEDAVLALKIIGGILLVLLFLLLCPVRAQIAFREEFALTIRYLFWKVPVLPGEEKPEEESAPESAEKPKEEKGDRLNLQVKAILKRKGFFGFLESFFELVGVLLRGVWKILSHLKLRRFDLYLRVGGREDASAAAVLYGQLAAGVYGACGALFAKMKPKEKGVTVDLDYGEAENLVDFSGELSIRPVFVVGHGLAMLLRALPKALDLLGIKLFARKDKSERKVTAK